MVDFFGWRGQKVVVGLLESSDQGRLRRLDLTAALFGPILVLSYPVSETVSIDQAITAPSGAGFDIKLAVAGVHDITC